MEELLNILIVVALGAVIVAETFLPATPKEPRERTPRWPRSARAARSHVAWSSKRLVR